VRITTRWYPEFLSPALFGTLHESGHAIYEQGTHPDLARTPLARGASSGIHESQSRMIENLVGRSRVFWQAHFPSLQALFPEQLGKHTVEDFYRAINKVQPSFIRVEADELTYNLHVILRFELERELVAGELPVAEVPARWNQLMQEFLGITPADDAQGCLQDIHWSMGAIGYFPTYTMGNLYAAQFHEAARRALPDLDDQIREGRFDALREWLRVHIHDQGKRQLPAELVQDVCGEAPSPQPFLAYVRDKMDAIYGDD
jgi:carboxypeptidase Taq